LNFAHPKLERVLLWARQDDAIRALVLTGSLARDDGATDEFSDLDVQVITADVKRFTSDDSWLDTLGEVWIRFPLNQDAPFRLVWFRGGIKVDFQFLDLGDIRPTALTDEYARGYQILLDKDDLFRDLPPSPREFAPQPQPSAAAVRDAINEFWFEALHVAQFIRRREFWVVKHRDWTMKQDLLRMLEWQARATRPQPANTGTIGRGVTSWTDDEAKAAIKRIWASWNPKELWDALLLQMKLFRRLSLELNQRLGYEYDDKRHREIEIYIRLLRREDSGTSSKG